MLHKTPVLPALCWIQEKKLENETRESFKNIPWIMIFPYEIFKKKKVWLFDTDMLNLPKYLHTPNFKHML
jgi:hypothetical protein